MTVNQARTWIILASFCLTVGLILFAIIAPATSYPLEYPDAFRIIEIVLPVVTGYLGTAAHHLFAGNPTDKPLPAAWPWFRYLVKGPIVVLSVILVALVITFGFSHRASSTSGMSPDIFAHFVTAAVSVLTLTTSVVVAQLFRIAEQK